VIAYASRKLDRRESNYCTTRRELLAVVYFIKRFRHYLLGERFTVRSDHAALAWLRRIPEPVGQQARWLEILEEYDFEIVHRPGLQHANADGLSRIPCDRARCCPRGQTGEIAHARAVEIIPASQPISMREAQENDSDFGPILSKKSETAEQPTWDDIAHLSGETQKLYGDNGIGWFYATVFGAERTNPQGVRLLRGRLSCHVLCVVTSCKKFMQVSAGDT
jgi:RNase H-like domain found in reverse transcriptase